ncbi:MAG: class I SAM-dependent methyltransferase, partial [Actinobacteria bacterium]|nr:class I SAM-dependent methyltransferase [Actinomycetota bacterium]
MEINKHRDTMYKTFAFDDNADEYDRWYNSNKEIYQSELLALKQVVPAGKRSLEVGVGTGRFAVPLGVRIGAEPSEAMSSIARQRGIKVKKGFAENLPFKDKSFDFVLFVTTICFLDDISKALKEAYRVLVKNGEIIIGLIDKNSDLGKKYEKMKEKNKFYKDAHFYS